jgi:hypothetical protein
MPDPFSAGAAARASAQLACTTRRRLHVTADWALAEIGAGEDADSAALPSAVSPIRSARIVEARPREPLGRTFTVGRRAITSQPERNTPAYRLGRLSFGHAIAGRCYGDAGRATPLAVGLVRGDEPANLDPRSASRRVSVKEDAVAGSSQPLTRPGSPASMRMNLRHRARRSGAPIRQASADRG